MIEISPEQLAELEDAVEADPGATCFAVLAELHRRAGRLAECERVLRQGLERKPESRDGRLVLASVMLDRGRDVDARDELEALTGELLASHGLGVVGREPVLETDDDLSDSEFDAAFERAETDVEELIDPNRVAEEALDHVDRLGGASGDDLVEPGGTFSTASMAELLERQGDFDAAARIREGLENAAPVASPAPAAPPSVEPNRSKPIATLERWLENLRRSR